MHMQSKIARNPRDGRAPTSNFKPQRLYKFARLNTMILDASYEEVVEALEFVRARRDELIKLEGRSYTQSLTPEQHERRKAYWRERHQKRKGGAASNA